MNFPYTRLENLAIFSCRSELARESVQYSPLASTRFIAGYRLTRSRYVLEPVIGMPVTANRGSDKSINNNGETP